MTSADFTYRSRYWDDPAARAAFKSFLLEIHGLDLSLWEQCGFWDPQYVPYSLFASDGRIVASACVYEMDMMLDGRRCRLGQFSGMGTRPEFRRRGLARWLTERAMRETAARCAGYFLFADDEALAFYQRCGFMPVNEESPTLAVENLPAPVHPRKLDPSDANDRGLVYRLACERVPVSNVLGVLTPRLAMFHFLYTLADCTYYAESLDVAIAFRVKGGGLILYDVIGPRVPTFAEIHPYLATQPHDEVTFYFVPDRMDVTPTGSRPLRGNNTHADPQLRLPAKPILFPFVSHA